MILSEISYRPFINSTLNSYSQVFFSDNRFFSVVLLIVSFIDPNAGMAGLVSVLITNLTAWQLGFNRTEIEKGYYGFNSLLVGLGIGYFFSASLQLYLIIFSAAILTLMFVTMFRGILQKYGLPYLSVPFLFGLWTILIASKYFDSLGISQKGIYTLNWLYSLGGSSLVNLYERLNTIHPGFSVETYFKSIGAIFFQYSIGAGILLAAGLLVFSRIAFMLSVYGFYLAFLFYRILGGNIVELSYTYIGFNYILTAIAIGGFYMIPSRKTFLWLLILIPIVTLLTISLSRIFAVFQLSIYALPFNIVVLLFIYALKFRMYPSDKLKEVYFQQNSPERNLYTFLNQKENALHHNMIPFKLPFYGKWTVLQGHNGEYTHKEEWRHAWDFIILDEQGHQFENAGDYPHEYYCFGKSVLAPAPGTITEIIDDQDDNTIGNVNLQNNWGNSVVIKHGEYLYSSLSHLKSGSVCVKAGDKVKAGQKVGETGNSGRSAYPHLHLQFQAAPYIGSKTLDYPLGYYLEISNGHKSLKSFQRPEKDHRVMNIEATPLLKNTLNFIPGQLINITSARKDVEKQATWEVFTTAQNTSYIYEKSSGSLAWFVNDDNMLYFTHFQGRKSSLLYMFYQGLFRVLKAWYPDLELKDELPQNQTFSFPLLTIQDFAAPFFIFLRSNYTLHYAGIDNPIQPSEITLHSELHKQVFGRTVKKHFFDIRISAKSIKLNMNTGKDEITSEIS
ncbi:MAG TPA: urea transporter [Bacteroidales bacterium]|nr:urea transporter [Bacteroidales bacterium]